MKRIIISITALLFIAAFAASSLSGCGSKPAGPKLQRVNIAFQDWVGYGPFYLGKEKGFFEKEGIDLVIVDEQLDSARRDAFLSGMLDCEGSTLDLLISKVAKGVPLVAVMRIDTSYGGDAIVADSSIQKLQDLFGRRVAMARDDVGESFISSLFYKNTLMFESVVVVSVRPNEAAKYFINGDADACVTWQPYVTEALKRPGSHILADTKAYPNIIIDTLNVRADLVEKDPRLVKKIMRGWFRSLDYTKEHPDESYAIISRHYGISPQQYAEQVKQLKWYGYEDQKAQEGLQQWQDATRLIAEVKLINGRIPKRIDTSVLLNQDLIKRLYEDSD